MKGKVEEMFDLFVRLVELRRHGVCPTCHRTNGYVADDPDHIWFFCNQHKSRWDYGRDVDLNISWIENPEEERRYDQKLVEEPYTVVEPYRQKVPYDSLADDCLF
jgi:hypothetical protein